MEATAQNTKTSESSVRSVGIIRDARYLNHSAGDYHPESPDRLQTIYDRLDQDDVRGRYQLISPRFASEEELTWNHTPQYIELLAKTAGRAPCRLDPDTGTSAGSWDAARLAVGGVFAGLDAIASSDVNTAFALVRPPGHHAETDRAMGFCLFNNIALGAYYAINRLSYRRVLIVDWDLHHGNGTQNSFYASPDILYFSTHQYPYYPGSGSAQETGTAQGDGFTVNVPVDPGAGDLDFAAVFNHILLPIGKAFSPDLILVSAGFDIYEQDPLGGMRVSILGFAYLARCLLSLAESTCQGKTLFCLEGGYHLRGLRDGVLAVLNECEGNSQLDPAMAREFESAELNPGLADRIYRIQSGFWPLSTKSGQ